MLNLTELFEQAKSLSFLLSPLQLHSTMSGIGGMTPHRPLTASHPSYQRQPHMVMSSQSFQSKHVMVLSKLQLHDCKSLTERTINEEYPWEIMILSDNTITRLHGLQMCINLKKLDLSSNQMKTLPNSNFWSCFKQLTTLFLHNNKLDSIHSLQSLAALPELRILTVHGMYYLYLHISFTLRQPSFQLYI